MKKIKILIVGDCKSNAGPANVNKNIIKFSSNIRYVKSKNYLLKWIELIIKLFSCNVILITGWNNNGNNICKFSKLFRKKVIYLMHGNMKIENEINKLNLSEKILLNENRFLNNVDLILCVSKLYRDNVLKKYPNLKKKMFYLNNGININFKKNIQYNNTNSQTIKIAVAGGNRCIKNNSEVCKAIEKLHTMGYNIELNIYGRFYKNNDNIISNKFINIRQHLNQEDFYEELRKSYLFILNSEIESFGLSLIEALQCGCNVLISKNVGAISIIKANENDIINNPHDINEIKEKIIYVLSNPNNERIMESIDFEENSWTSYCNKLTNICDLVIKSDYSFIFEEENYE